MSCRLFSCLLIALAGLALPLVAGDDDDPATAFADMPRKDRIPFGPGEEIVLRLEWAGIPVGRATFAVAPMSKHEGRRTWHLVMTARTNAFADRIFKVRDRLESHVAADFSRSLHFTKKQREGSHRRDVVVAFDWRENTAQYSNAGKPRKPIAIAPDTFDELAFFYCARRLQIEAGDVIKDIHVSDGKHEVSAVIHVRRRETIEVGGCQYDTFLLEPQIEGVGGVFAKSKDARLQIWVSADEACIPVRIRSKVAVGHFTAELVRHTEGEPDPEAAWQAVE